MLAAAVRQSRSRISFDSEKERERERVCRTLHVDRKDNYAYDT